MRQPDGQFQIIAAIAGAVIAHPEVALHNSYSLGNTSAMRVASHDFNTPSALDDEQQESIMILGRVMKQSYLASLSTDELWLLHERINATLNEKLSAEIEMLEKRLRRLKRVGVEQTVTRPERRPYPAVLSKFRNPDQPSETWAGRGKQPRWLREHLRSGKQMDDFRIESVAA
jgi:DNA-binding protein H-NS